MIEIRLATPADVAAIRELTLKAYAKWVAVIGREPMPMRADYEAAVRQNRFDLLYLDGALAALIETVDQGDRLLVENVAVSPGFQRRGLGTRLLAHAEQVAGELGHALIWLYTNAAFAGNVALYRRLGYRIDREQDLGDGTVRVDMSKSLVNRSDAPA